MQLVLLCSALLLVLPASVAKSDRPFCGRPPEIKHANVEYVKNAADQLQDIHEVGTEIVYSCQFGYLASSRSRIIRCDQVGDEAKWEEPKISCKPRSCGDPGHIRNGYRVGSLFTFPNNVTYHCDDGYVLRGIDGRTRYCQTSGQWSGRLPVCEVVTCDHPKDVPNGEVTVSSYEYGATLTYRCDTGYRLSSNEDIYCTEKGEWSKTDVICEETLCDMPKKPQFGHITFRGTDERPRAGSIVLFSCEEGRIPSGPTTSKCLDIGEWTFPAPKCLEPCTIQPIFNGVIGTYVRKSYWSSSTVFKEIEVGTRVEKEDLYIRCNEGFENPDSGTLETKITCSKGLWSSELECNPASCRSSPPHSENAKIVELDSEHEGFVSYDCFPDYRKTAVETVVCSHGQWNGEPPQCKLTKCSSDSLVHPGVVKGLKPFYSDGEVLSYTCYYPRYEIPAGHNGQIICIDGMWTGESPFCVAANCSIPPPLIAHGKVKDLRTFHGAVAKYSCEDPYFLVSSSLVQCSYGTWEGQLPECRDSRCYMSNLRFKSYVSPHTQTVTSSGNKLNVICKEGYSANTKLPTCEKGIWKENDYELCKDSDCQVPEIRHGSLKYEIFGDYYFSFRKFRYERTIDYKTVPEGNTVPSGDELNLFCEGYYTFQGTEYQGAKIKCFKGKWNSDPVCLRRGQIYIPTTTVKPRLLSILTTNPPSAVTSSPGRNDPTESPSKTTFSSTNEEVTTRVPTMDTTSDSFEDRCSCIYPLEDDNVVAHANGKKLSLGDKVRDGATVVFRCLHVGFHHLIGRRKISCTDCQTWHSSDFPFCMEPKKGNVVIIHDQDEKVLEDGSIQIDKGKNVNFSCIALETTEYPTWEIPNTDRISFRTETIDREEYHVVLYQTHLYIHDADYRHEGPYHCYKKNNEKTTINIVVIDPGIHCPELPNEDNLVITYEEDRLESTKAFFSCPNKNQELIGEPVLTCLRSEEWSAPIPYCADVRCEVLNETDNLAIVYYGHRKVNSTASFHCFRPAKRKGVSTTKCLQNGTWADPIPTCKIPPCTAESLLSSLPHNVQPAMKIGKDDSFDYNTTVKLTCKNDMIVIGNPFATCGRGSIWSYQKIECGYGCQPPTRHANSMLKIIPEKNEYKFGDQVTLSCPPGMELDSEFQVIACLMNGWSEKIVPDCVYEEKGDYQTTQQTIPLTSEEEN